MKSTTGSVQLLGTGASLGVPRLACNCPICQSTNPKWHRTRTSALIHVGNKDFLIDVGPDFRQQALRAKIEKIDALLVTHVHYDHIAGIDDLRALFYHTKKTIPIYGSLESLKEIETRFHYLFVPKAGLPRELALYPLYENEGVVDIEGVPVRYFSFYQQKMKVTGFRFAKMAYVTDIKQYEPPMLSHLKNLDLLILSALSNKESAMHLTLDESVAFAHKIGAKRTLLVHLSHDVDPEQVSAHLPESIELGYDGQTVSFGM